MSDNPSQLRSFANYVVSRVQESPILPFAGISVIGAVAILLAQHRKDKQTQAKIDAKFNAKKLLEQRNGLAVNEKKPNRGKEDFRKNLLQLLAIVFPRLVSKESLMLLLHTSFLVGRTFLSILVANLDGAIVKTLVGRDGKGFLYYLLVWILLAIPATFVNSMIRYLESKLSIAFRTKLVMHCYEKYMANETYYRVGNLDSRLSNADQSLTEDVSKFCNFLAHLYSQLSKPIFDILLMTGQLILAGKDKQSSKSMLNSFTLGFGIVYATSKILKYVQPPFGQLVATQGKKEGKLRYIHSRLITNCEEIAFYRGHEIEKSILIKTYLSLVKHVNHIFNVRIIYNTWEGFFLKYIWSMTGMLLIALPAFFGQQEHTAVGGVETVTTRTEEYIVARGLLVSISDAIERIMLAYKEIAELEGYTERVARMLNVFEDCNRGQYQKATITNNKDGVHRDSAALQRKGETFEGANYIEFKGVPIVTPSGDVLVQQIDLLIRPGMHLLITGPNGCGKSSLFRMLGGLWPILGGSLTRPSYQNMFYIPQKPYLSVGNFRDQLIYPDTRAEFEAKGGTDKDLEDILQAVDLMPILKRIGGWDSVQVWMDVLSGGEKQRVGMARIFYHKPQFAILDECTSQVSINIEGAMYLHAIKIGITLLTVTHRPSLYKFHNWLLQFDGQGNWSFGELNASTRVSLRQEKDSLEEKLRDIPKMEERLQQLCELLGEDSNILQGTAKGKRLSQHGDELLASNVHEPHVASPLTLTSDDEDREKDDGLHSASTASSAKESSVARERDAEPAEGDLDETVLFEGS